MNDSTPTTARIGVTSGRMIRKNVVVCDAPSTLADSSSSIGTVSKKPFISHVFTPRAPPMYSRIRLHERVEADRRVQVGDGREHDVDGHDGQELREHLDDQQEQQARPATAEPEARERVGGERREGQREQGRERRR